MRRRRGTDMAGDGRRWRCLCSIAAIALLGAGSEARAQHTIHVRAESRIELRTEIGAGSVLVFGALRDDLGAPLVDREIELRVLDGAGTSLVTRPLRTSAGGEFRTRLSVRADTMVRVSFAGDDDHERTEAERMLDFTRAEVELHVEAPGAGRLDLDTPAHPIEIRARSRVGASGLRVHIHDELGRPLASILTAADGAARVELESSALGDVGAGRLVVRSEADVTRTEAQTEVPIVRYRRATLTLAVDRGRAKTGDPLRAQGALRDHTGPLRRRAIGLFAGESHLGTVLTDAEGAFAFTFPMPEGDGADLELMARFDGDAPWRPAVATRAIRVERVLPADLSWVFPLLSFVVCALALLALARKKKTPLRAPEARPERPQAGLARGTRRVARPELVSISGVVIDVSTGAPVRDAKVWLVVEGAPEVIEIGGADFYLERAPTGSHVLAAGAPGYTPLRFTITVPHRGEHDGMSMRLESLRVRTLDALAPLTDAVRPRQGARDAALTVRETVDAIGRGHPTVAATAEDLGTRVERAAYALDPPLEEEVAAVEARAGEIAEALRPPKPRV